MTTCPRCLRTYEDGVRFCPADGAVVTPGEVDPYLGKVLMGQFEITALAGRGAMGTVYRAEQTSMGRTVAVKILRRDLMRDPGVVKRFLREARAAARLSHPNIVIVHMVGEADDGLPFIVMEFVDGESLGALTDREPVLAPRRAIRIARQIASALSEAHHHGIIHRDLKPENILLVAKRRESDVVKVLDFGIAKILRDEAGEVSALTRDGTIFGTPHYISPEQASGHEVDARADLYSLGVVLFRMVTGQLPFDGTSGMQVVLRHLKELPPRPRAIRPELPEALEKVILQSLEKERGERFQDAETLIAALDAVDHSLDGDASRTLMGVAVPKRGQKPVRPPSPAAASPSPVLDDPQRTRDGEMGLDAWAATAPEGGDDGDDGAVSGERDVEPTDRISHERSLDDRRDAARFAGEEGSVVVDDDALDTPPRRSRVALWASLGAVMLGGGVGVIYAMRGATPNPPTVPVATVASDGGAAPRAAREPARKQLDLFDPHVATDGPFAMRLGFQSPPIQGTPTLLRVSIDDSRGGAVADARFEVAMRTPGGVIERVAVLPDPVDGSYLAELAFRAGGPHHIEVNAHPPGGKRMTSAFEFDVARGTASSHTPSPARHPAERRPKPPTEADDDDTSQLPTTVIPPGPSPQDRPHSIGPAPQSTVTQPRPPPQVVAIPPAPPPVATPVDNTRPDPQPDDPYQILDRR